MLLIGKPSISMGHLYHGYVSHNQRVYTLPILDTLQENKFSAGERFDIPIPKD